MSETVRTAHVGLGHMGAEIARLVHRRDDMKIAGAVDVAPDKAGADLGEVIGLDHRLGLPVAGSIAAVLSQTEADVAVQATGSHLPQVYPQLIELITGGLSVVSTCEELAYAGLQHPKLAAELHRMALEHGVGYWAPELTPVSSWTGCPSS